MNFIFNYMSNFLSCNFCGRTGKTEIAFVRNRLNAQSCQQPQKRIFLHNQIPLVLSSTCIKLRIRLVTLQSRLLNDLWTGHIIDRSTITLDLNPVKTCCCILARAVKADKRQYNRTTALKVVFSPGFKILYKMLANNCSNHAK